MLLRQAKKQERSRDFTAIARLQRENNPVQEIQKDEQSGQMYKHNFQQGVIPALQPQALWAAAEARE
ncbi:hypothetical protein AGMMS49925_04400 [Deltaproteobacteria bacterium]|nr:hypothetical protein AGMMS49925_04400 [Deltaproteobacteria bacterium]